MTEIIPGLQTKDAFEAKHKIDLLLGKVSWFHIDICDGEFVPNETIWSTEVRLLRPIVPFNLHLMAKITEEVIDDFATTDADSLFFYPKATTDTAAMINSTHDLGKKVGLVVDLDDQIEVVTPFLSKIEFVLLMAVQSGFAGQKFHPEVLTKITALKKMVGNFKIGVDGGIRVGTASLAAKAGADFVVANSAIWQEADLQEAIDNLRQDVVV